MNKPKEWLRASCHVCEKEYQRKNHEDYSTCCSPECQHIFDTEDDSAKQARNEAHVAKFYDNCSSCPSSKYCYCACEHGYIDYEDDFQGE